MFQIKTKIDAGEFLELISEEEFEIERLTNYLSENLAMKIKRKEDDTIEIKIIGIGIETIPLKIDYRELIHKMRKDVNIAIRETKSSYYNEVFTENENLPRIRRRTTEPKTSVRITEEEKIIIKEHRKEKEKKVREEIIIEEEIEPRPLSMLKNILYTKWLKEEKEHYRTSGVAAYARIADEEEGITWNERHGNK